MDRLNGNSDGTLTALLISPSREIAERFTATNVQSRAFQILVDMRSYPPLQTLDVRLRQLKPDVVLLDVATEFETAAEIIRTTTAFQPTIHVVGLHTSNDSQSILNALRLGATEFLYSPFEASVVFEAVARIRRLKRPDEMAEPQLGKVVSFSSVFPVPHAERVIEDHYLCSSCTQCKKSFTSKHWPGHDEHEAQDRQFGVRRRNVQLSDL